MSEFQYYTRQGCHLCELMLEELLPLVRTRIRIDVRDIDLRPEWRDKYDVRVPVIEYEGRVISEYPLDFDAIKAVLTELPQDKP